MTSGRDIVVVGAGAFGVTAAWELALRGWTVTLLDRGPVPHPDASSTDISKMIRMDYGSDVFYHELAEAALEGWERWNLDWPRPLYHDEGFLVLAAGAMEPGGFEYESRRVLLERGYEPSRLSADKLRRRYPKWNADEYFDGYLSPRGGWAESGAVVQRLSLEAAGAGVRSGRGSVAQLTYDGQSTGLDLRLTTGETLRPDHVVVCAGAWTPELVPETAPLLAAVAQPVLHFGVEEPDDYRGPSFPPFAADIAGSGWYGFPALEDRRLKLGHHGPGRPVLPGGRGAVPVDHVALARRFLGHAIPSLAEAPLVGSRVCMYCDSRDGDLLIDRVPGREDLTIAAGGSGHGFKFAPVLGGIIADAVEGRTNPWTQRFRWRVPEAVKSEEARLLDSRG
ncbi:MAG: FAD-dependent oxidoreductase [Gemmatimonadetes bacterium]|nr:FAD-dependent oxidoreductase [Gemmatimonadota bacterium]NNF13931.1 FAD-dependent oxidoreductase [Gemmatimonadota bacterium]NNL30481.1 FAD-dependent oxidoreductase [Gemmatimonadota bacterium]